MAIAVNLWTNKKGVLKEFLQKYYQKEVDLEEDVEQWIYVYRSPLEAVDMISVVIDNNNKYELSMCIQIDDYDVHTVTYENHNDIIKGIYHLYYN